MTKEYLVSGNRFDLANDSVVLTGKRSASGPEIRLRVPVGTLLSLAMHARRALAGAQAQKAETVAGWKQVSALPIRTAKVLVPDDQTIGRCLLVLDEGTDAELQLSFPSAGFVRELAGELLAAADRIPQTKDERIERCHAAPPLDNLAGTMQPRWASHLNARKEPSWLKKPHHP